MRILNKIGKFAAKQIPGLGIILDGVELVGDLIGGKTKEKIKQGTALIAEGMNEVGATSLTPEQQIAMEEIQTKKTIELKEIAYKDKKLSYDDQAGGRDVVKTALLSDDPIVRRARPVMMKRLGMFAMIYTAFTPLLVLNLAYFGVSFAIIELMINLALWQGGTLWGAFITSFTGYTVARSSDKKVAGLAEIGKDPSKLLKTLSKLGHKVS